MILSAVGVLVAAGAGAASIVLPAGRPRAAAMLIALALFPLLILGDQWRSSQIADLREPAGRLVALGIVAVAAAAVLAAVFHRRPILLPLAIVAALPFRVPLHAGGDTANLLIPLYLVIAGGVLAVASRSWLSSASRAGGAVGGTAPEDASATAGDGGSPTATGPASHHGPTGPASHHGPTGPASHHGPTGPARPHLAARAAVLATFVALLVHTMAYAGFYEDPIAWVLLAAAASLSGAASTAFASCSPIPDKQRTRG